MRFSPMDVVLSLGAVLLVAVVVVLLIANGLSFVMRRRCLDCRRKSLDYLSFSAPRPGPWGFRCKHCGAEFCRQPGGPLVPRAAWDEGVRGEIPEARVIRKRA
ncbi:MAG TPA: hypothetical protein VH165_36985 [Kofleriaceae bacterium]|jgi:hypothetical protein|nr:hypothetical protein [Kofleriaceae bacterium]